MTERKSILPMMAVTVIITAALAVGVTVYVIDATEKNTTDDVNVELTQDCYGAYATYTLTAKCDGTVKASDGGTFLVNGESVNTFNFVKDATYTLTFYGGAVPEVSP